MNNFEKNNYLHNFEKSSLELETYIYLLQSFQFTINKKDFKNKFNYNIEDKFCNVIKYLEDN
jgi:hypothetical protein